MDYSRLFWQPDAIWRGETAFLLGGGPSLKGFNRSRLTRRGHRVIAINSSYRIANSQDLLFFTDNSWFEQHQPVIDLWRGYVVTLSRHAKAAMPQKVRRIECEEGAAFVPGRTPVRLGRSSGQTAISLAILLGATRVVLLGYDMRMVEGRSHHHDDHSHDNDSDLRRYANSFGGWAQATAEAGVEVLNATPGSALTEFPFRSLDDVLDS